jgi:hypothetical protein
VGYGLVKFDGAEGMTEITKIGTFVLYAGSGIEITIFGEFDGQLSELLFQTEEVICDLPGYYTFDLDSTIFIPENKTFFIQVKYDSKNADNKWPIAVEDTIATYSKPHIETGKFWVAPNPEIWPTAWYQAGHGTSLKYDLCIKAYSKTHPLPPSPVAIAGEDATVVEGNDLLISGNAAENFTSLYWTTTGDGIFDDETTLNPTYFPGLTDIAAGNTDLIFHAVGAPPLNLIATDTLNLTIWRYPSVEILAPVNQEKICDCVFTILGTASDPDINLLAVEVRINDGDWLPADGIGNWSLTVTLNPGINTIAARATDDTDLVTKIPDFEVNCSIQTIDLFEGWSVISGFLSPDNLNVELLLADIAENLVVIQNMSGMFAPPPINVNTMGNWSMMSGYKLKMLADDQLVYCGDLPESNSASFSPGYHIVPYLSNQSATIEELFDDPSNDILYLFDLNTSTVYWPLGEIFTLTALHPGTGYQGYFLNPVTIDFPEDEGFFFTKNMKVKDVQYSHWPFAKTGNHHFFSISQDALCNLRNGLIGAFDEQDNCIGSVEMPNSENGNLLLAVYGDDEITRVKNGAWEGERISFKFFDHQNNAEIVLSAAFDPSFPDSEGMFVTNGMSKVTGLYPLTFVGNADSHENSVVIFPNPAKGFLNVVFQKPMSVVIIEIFTSDGKLIRKVRNSDSEVRINLEGISPGLYFIKVETETGVVYKRFVLQ